MVFCVPTGRERVIIGPNGTPIVQYEAMCYGTDVPAPDLPAFELPPDSIDLPEFDIPAPGPDISIEGIPPANADPTDRVDTETQSEADVDEDVCIAGCNACSALLNGYEEWRNYWPDLAEYHPENIWQGYRYQADTCGLEHDPVGGRIKEWQFANYSWDGFEAGTCTMLEAKWGYRNLLEVFYRNSVPTPRPMPGREALATARFARLIAQATTQSGRISGYPEVGLKWMFAFWEPFIFFQMSGGTALPMLVVHIPGRED